MCLNLSLSINSVYVCLCQCMFMPMCVFLPVLLCTMSECVPVSVSVTLSKLVCAWDNLEIIKKRDWARERGEEKQVCMCSCVCVCGRRYKVREIMQISLP